MNTKQKIYEVAKTLFIKEGYHNVTNKKIAEVAGVNQGLITYYFKQKSNIAMTIFKENYQIISSYLRSNVDVNEDPFLFNISVDNLMYQLTKINPNFNRFSYDMIGENAFLDSIYTGSQKKDIIIMIRKLAPDSEANIQKHFRKFVTITFPVALQFQKEISIGTPFSFDEYFGTMVHLFVFALNLKWDDTVIDNYIEKANKIVSKTIEKYPVVTKTEEYLLNEGILGDIYRE